MEDPYKIAGGIGNISGCNPYLISFTATGTWTKKLLYTIDENSAYIHPTKFYYKNQSEILIYGQRENKIRFGLIKL